MLIFDFHMHENESALNAICKDLAIKKNFELKLFMFV
jgi:hypothetical protein